MKQVLVISVRLHEGRYHGLGDEVPAPARVFQALIAGTGLSGPLSRDAITALEWLERLDAPVIAAPHMWGGQSLTNYVPNNELDAVAGDHRRIGSVKTSKPIKPKLFDGTIPLHFGWPFTWDANSEITSGTICSMAERVYQFGRGVDFAWAYAEVINRTDFESQLAAYPGRVYRPTPGGSGATIATPKFGSWRSLQERYAWSGRRLRPVGDAKSVRYELTQPPKPRFAEITYDSPPDRASFELRSTVDEAKFVPWPLERVCKLVELMRDAAVERLRSALMEQRGEIDRALIGRRPNGENSGASSARVRIIPLPSIGYPQADIQIRRVLVEIPAECPIRADDIFWAFSGLRLVHPVVAEPIDLTRSRDDSQLPHFGVNKPAHAWRTVTAAVLPDAARRRIDPSRRRAEAKSGAERYAEQTKASFAVAQAMRHAGVQSKVSSVRVQREPFDLRGIRVEPFAEGTRFSKHSLWHVEVEFETPVAGPLLIGNGRFLGLGLMRPLSR